MNWAAIIWLVLMIFFIFIEASTVSIVSLWFAFGALVAMIVSFFGAEIWLQILLFAAVSCILLAALRPLVHKYFTPKLIRTNVDAIIGQTGIVLEKIDNISAQGKVKLGAVEWSARSTAQESIEPGTKVTVDRVEGVKVFVTPVKETVHIQ